MQNVQRAVPASGRTANGNFLQRTTNFILWVTFPFDLKFNIEKVHVARNKSYVAETDLFLLTRCICNGNCWRFLSYRATWADPKIPKRWFEHSLNARHQVSNFKGVKLSFTLRYRIRKRMRYTFQNTYVVSRFMIFLTLESFLFKDDSR